MSEHVFTETTQEKQLAALTAALREIQEVNRRALRGELSFVAAAGRIAVITSDTIALETR